MEAGVEAEAEASREAFRIPGTSFPPSRSLTRAPTAGLAGWKPGSKPRPKPRGKHSGDVVSPKSVVDTSADRRLGGGFDAKLVKPSSNPRLRPRGKLSGEAGPHSESLVDTSISSNRRLDVDAAKRPMPYSNKAFSRIGFANNS